MSIRCINDHLRAQPSILNNFNRNFSNEFDSISTYQYINNLTDKLTLSQKDFLNDFCPFFYKINNLDELSHKIELIFEIFDSNKSKKKFDYLEHEIDDQMGKSKILILILFDYFVNRLNG